MHGLDEPFRSDPQQGKTRLTKVVEQLSKNQFDAFLFSRGGNDIAGPESRSSMHCRIPTRTSSIEL